MLTDDTWSSSNASPPLMRTLLPLVAIWLAAHVVATQGQEPSFDVASIKVNTSGAQVSRMSAPSGTGRFEATNASVRALILLAYRLQGFQLTGGPSWIDTLRVDIEARATEATATRDEIERMLRALLAERFHLAIHREPRETAIYALMVARDDGRLGPRLQASTTDCAASAGARGAAPQSPSGQLLCGTRISPTSINAGGMSMARLAVTLSGMVGRLVTDDTRLTATYDLQLTFIPEQPPLGVTTPPPADPDAPSIFAAVREQLGLKLDARRGMVDVVVIDRVDPPDQN
jgi:uncharacterized protein (TIGR03435 family)